MREIKFRAWDIDCKIMRDWSWIRRREFPFYSVEIGYDLLNEKYFNVMQYTGLKDKNGTDIYEGDILCWPQYEGKEFQTRWVMEWNNERAAWSDYSPREDAGIIGNIYENPKLLKSNT